MHKDMSLTAGQTWDDAGLAALYPSILRWNHCIKYKSGYTFNEDLDQTPPPPIPPLMGWRRGRRPCGVGRRA